MRSLLVFGALIAATAAPAMAQEVTVSGNVAIVSDYQWRNVTQSNHDWTVQGGIDLDFGNGFSVGTWASGVDFQDEPEDTNLELDFYGSYAFALGGLDASVGFIYYSYPDAGTADLNFYEINGTLSKTWDKFTLGGSLNWDPDNETLYGDVSGALAVTEAFSLSAGYGTWFEGLGEYSGWNVGGTFSVGGVDLGLTYYDNDISGSDSNIVFSIGRSM